MSEIMKLTFFIHGDDNVYWEQQQAKKRGNVWTLKIPPELKDKTFGVLVMPKRHKQEFIPSDELTQVAEPTTKNGI